LANGNLGSENSHYREGDSVPFRAVLTNLDASAGNTHTLVIQYDTLQGGSTPMTTDLLRPNRDERGPGPRRLRTTMGNCFTIPVD
jgi:hypothetical protein